LIMLGDDLPHVRTGRGLECADVAPSRIHAVVSDVAAAVKVITDHDAVAAADSQFRLESRMANGHHPLVYVEVVCDDGFLRGSILCWYLNGRDRMRNRLRKPACAIAGTVPSEEALNDVHFRVE